MIFYTIHLTDVGLIPVYRKRRLRSKVCTPMTGSRCSRTWCVMPECHVVSRFCLLAGQYCVLPDECDGTPAHMQYHQAPVTAESCRPYPLGARSHAPDFPVPLERSGLTNVEVDLQRMFFKDDRRRSGTDLGTKTTCDGSLVKRICQVLAMPATAPSTDSPMLLSDLLLGYYLRRLQHSFMTHTCCIGYCRHSWNEPCKFGLPSTEVVTQMRTDDNAVRMVPRRTNLDDDAFNKTTSLAVLALTGMNVQINQHHPHGGHKGMLYSLKYSLKELVFKFILNI